MTFQLRRCAQQQYVRYSFRMSLELRTSAMKIASLFLLGVLALLSLSGNTRADSLGREAKCNSEISGCPRIYNPICGTDGNTYANECLLCHENKMRQIPVLIRKSGPC